MRWSAPLVAFVFLSASVSSADQPADANGDPLPAGALTRLGTTGFRHGGSIAGLAFSPDGTLLASSGADRSIRLWNTATGKLLRTIEDSRDPSSNLMFTPDGRNLIKSEPDATRLWAVATGKLIRELHGRFWGLSPDGKVLATGAVRKKQMYAVQIWDVSTGKEVCEFAGHSQPVLDLAFAPDGKTVATGGLDRTLRVWSTADGKERWNLPGLEAETPGMHSVAFSPDGKTLCQIDRTAVRFCDVSTGKDLPGLEETGALKPGGQTVLYTPDGKFLVTDNDRNGVGIWDLATRKLRHHLKGTLPSLLGDSKTVLVEAHYDNVLRFHDLQTGESKGELRGRYVYPSPTASSRDGKLFAAADWHFIRLWELPSLTERFPPDGASLPVGYVAVSGNGRKVASQTFRQDGVALWDVPTGKITKRVPVTPTGSATMALSPDGSRFAGMDAEVGVWETSGDKPVQRLEGSEGLITALAFSADGRMLGTVTNNPLVRVFTRPNICFKGPVPRIPTPAVLWDVGTGKVVHQLSLDGYGLHTLHFCGGPWLAAEDLLERGYLLWDISTGRRLRQLSGGFAAMSPDGKVLVVPTPRNRLALWEIATGQELFPLPEGVGDAVGLRFCRGGRFLAAGLRDGTVMIWDAGTGKEVQKLIGHRDRPTAFQVSADGCTLVTGGADMTLLVWDLRRLDARVGLPATPTEKELESLWEDLRADASRAHVATWKLVAADSVAVNLLEKHLRPAKDEDVQPIRKLVAELDHDEFEVRQAASKALATMGAEADVALHQTLAGKPSAEVRRRAEDLLHQLNWTFTAESVRGMRAVRVLELIGTEDARKLLEKLASGSKLAVLTHDAQAALDRWPRR